MLRNRKPQTWTETFVGPKQWKSDMRLWICRKWDVGGMNWIELAQGRDRWRELVNAVMNLRVS